MWLVYLTERAAKKKEISIRKEPDSTTEQPTKRVAPAPLLFTIINSTDNIDIQKKKKELSGL